MTAPPTEKPFPPRAARRRAPRGRRLGFRLARYVAGELVFPTLFTLIGFALLALTWQVLGFADLVINRGLGAAEVGWIALYQSVPAIERSLPFAVLVGALIGLGRLGADRELQAMQTSGIAPGRIGAPVLGFAALLAGAALAISLLASPWAVRGLDAALARIVREHPAATLRAGAVHTFGDFRLEAREVSPQGDHLRGVLLWVPSLGETFFAREADVEPTAGGTRLTLAEGILLTGTTPPSYLRFRQMQHELPAARGDDDAPALELAAADGTALRELAAHDPDPGRRREAAVEWHRRLALPCATFLLGALALPLALRRGHGSRTGGALLGVAATLAYYGLVQIGNGLLRSPSVSVVAAVWLPNLVLAAAVVGLWLLSRPRPSRAERSAARRVVVANVARAPHARRLPLDRYMLAIFSETTLLCFIALLVLFLLGDVVDNLQWFAKYRSTLDEVARFYTARLPVLASRVVPMALLVAATLTMSLLIVRGELMGMWACGVSTLRAVRSVLLLCVVVAVSYYGLSNELVPRANARASFLKQTEIKNRGHENVRTSLWYREGDHLYVLKQLDPLAGEATRVTIYDLDPDWLPEGRTDAARARHVGNGVWRLENPQRVEVVAGEAKLVDAHGFAELGEDVPAEVDTSHLTLSDLRRAIREVERSGYDATNYRVDFHQKLASPLACLVLPVLGLLIATAGPPFWTPAQTLVLCGAQALAYLVLSGVAASLGYGRFLPPPVAGFAPVAVVTGAAGFLALRSRVQRG